MSTQPYWQSEDGQIVIYHGDCLQIMAELPSASVDAVVTDPPYGIGKAEWDVSFDTSWMKLAARLADKLAVTPGVWNILDCPKEVNGLVYKWTLSARLVNGMTRGGLGFGNWIPLIIYTRKIYRKDVFEWCTRFHDWCESKSISTRDLNMATGTSDMGGWWASKLEHRCQVPAPSQWQKIKLAFNPPPEFDSLVAPSDYVPIGDCKEFVVGKGDKPDHPSPKPLPVMLWFLDSVAKRADTIILDPFMGSGTTGVACVQTGRKFVGIEIEEKFCEISKRRIIEAKAQTHMDFEAKVSE